jgi:hypothetical protein
LARPIATLEISPSPKPSGINKTGENSVPSDG